MNTASRSTLRVLRAGSVPDSDIRGLTVGADSLELVANIAFDNLERGVAPNPVFLNGEWGSGKTHSLQFIRSLAAGRGFATMEAVLNARTCPPNYPQRIYPSLVSNLAFGGDRGVRSVLQSLLQNDKPAGLALATPKSRTPTDIWHAANSLRSLSRSGETAMLGSHPAWRVLTGSDIAYSDYGYRRVKAIDRLHWLTGFLRSLGANGSVLLFDELETIDQLWNRVSRSAAYDVLGAFVSAPGVWCVFGITERFLRVVDEDARSDQFGSIGPAGRRFLSLWRRGAAEILTPPSISEGKARALATTVQRMYRSAYPDTAECRTDCERSVTDWARNSSRNPRRLVRSIVHTCDLARPLFLSTDLACEVGSV